MVEHLRTHMLDPGVELLLKRCCVRHRSSRESGGPIVTELDSVDRSRSEADRRRPRHDGFRAEAAAVLTGPG